MKKCTDKNCPPLPTKTKWWERAKGIGLCCLALYAGLLFGDRRWPYSEPKTIIYTPEVNPKPSGAWFEMGRDIDYREDCALRYTRMMLSAPDPAKDGAVRRIDLESKEFDSPPWTLDKRRWYIKEFVPPDFPCGPAQVVDSPKAACGWFQKNFWWQTRRDAITRFNVRCEAGSDTAKAPG